MIQHSFHIGRYDWDVVAFYDTTERDTTPVRRAMQWCGAKPHHLRDLARMVGGENTGMTYTDMRKRRSVLVISRTTSAKEFLNTFEHEKSHLTAHICKRCGIDPLGEEASYLSGDLAETMFRVCRRLMCDCCRKRVVS